MALLQSEISKATGFSSAESQEILPKYFLPLTNQASCHHGHHVTPRAIARDWSTLRLCNGAGKQVHLSRLQSTPLIPSKT